MTAVLSDIHANLEALEAVLADIASRQVDAVYCLGDTLGYGPDPLPCLDRVMRMDMVLLGNHDYAVLHEPDGFGLSAERAVLAHRTDLGGSVYSDRYREFLEGLPPRCQVGEVLLVHGSPHHPLNEYLFPEDAHNSPKMKRIGEQMPELCFCGHTHVPGVFFKHRSGEWTHYAPDDFDGAWVLDGQKTIVNVGSVGQPRDGDPRAGYVLWDGETVRFVRIAYDVATTIRKIHRRPDLDDFLGDRLGEGR